VVNIDAYEALSDAEREALDSSIPEALDHYLANYAELLQRWDSVLEEKGVKKVEIDEAVIAEFRAKAADPIRDKWIADMEAQGLPGQELYDLVAKTLADAKSGS
jgi:TRAP-type C4-dicarboxylate transport system substrate-binding protein